MVFGLDFFCKQPEQLPFSPPRTGRSCGTTLATAFVRQRPSVGGYASQFARTLLRLCFAKLLVLLVGGPDDATACAPYGARPVASGNLTTSSQVHLVAGVSRAHPTRRLWRGRISGRFGVLEIGRGKLLNFQSPKLQEAEAKKIKPSYRQEALAMGVRP